MTFNIGFPVVFVDNESMPARHVSKLIEFYNYSIGVSSIKSCAKLPVTCCEPMKSMMIHEKHEK